MTNGSTPSRNVALVQSMYAAFERNDTEALAAAMDPDIDWHEAESSPYHKPGGHHGAGEVFANVLGRVPADFDQFRVVPHAFHDAGDTVVVEARYQATAKATSDPLDAEVCHIWTMRGGRAIGFQQYADTWQLAHVTRHQPE